MLPEGVSTFWLPLAMAVAVVLGFGGLGFALVTAFRQPRAPEWAAESVQDEPLRAVE
jgi:hypothetical protein